MLRRVAFPISVITLLCLFACSRAGKEESQPQNPPPVAQQPAAQQPAAPAQPVESAAKPEPAPARAEAAKSAPRPVTSQPKATPAAAPAAPSGTLETKPAAVAPAAPKAAIEPVVPPQPKTVWVPSGTRFEVRLTHPVSSAENKSGETFKAIVDKNLEVEGKVVVPRGSTVTGKLIEVSQPGRVKGRATLSMTLTEITVEQTSYPIKTNTLSFEADSGTKRDATKIGIGAAAGAIIGAIAGGGKGAAIGAAVGGGAGTATVLATKGKDVEFSAEERFSFVLQADLGIKQ